ncbi:MAG: hypothetical protein RBR65_01175 [Aliarcobacter sp.]|jgi:cytochrome c peroxidase|nr:hypothetical protein [Aliarcobacter sp.]
MAAAPALVEKRINSMATYGKDVKVDFEKITATIATFEKTLVTHSKFDDYLNGEEKALNAEEKKGLTFSKKYL